MRKLVSQLFVSLDGVVESPERWHLGYYNEEMQAAVDSQIVECDILLLGRTTYEVFAASWPTRGSDVPLADRINSMPKLVASTTLDRLHWQNSTLIRGNVAEELTTPALGPSGAAASPATISRATRALLLCGVAAGPCSPSPPPPRSSPAEGFDLRRNAASVLSNGDLGWIQVGNYLVTGLLFLAGAVGMRRVMRSGRGGTWRPRLIGAYGVGLAAAGVFRPDPANGFPAGAPPGTRSIRAGTAPCTSPSRP